MGSIESAYCTEIAERLKDFRLGEIPIRTSSMVLNFLDDVNSVCTWMEKIDRLNFLAGLNLSIQNHYWSKSRIQEEITTYFQSQNYDLWAGDWQIIQIEESASSQTQLAQQLSFANPILTINENTNKIFYIDDATFSGSQLNQHLGILCRQIWDMDVISRQLIIFHLCEFSRVIDEQIRSPLRSLRKAKVDIHFERIGKFGISETENLPLGVLRPKFRSNYIDTLNVQTSVGVGKTYNWRSSEEVPFDGIFTSDEMRDLMERIFMETGLHIISLAKIPNSNLGPLGFIKNQDQNRLGFGSMFCSCFNSSNNSPLAPWWGNPEYPANHTLRKWTPLLPRKVQPKVTSA